MTPPAAAEDAALSPDIELVRALSSRENYEAFRPFVKEYAVLPEVLPIVEDVGAWLTKHPTEPCVEWRAFLAWARVHQRPSWKPDRWAVYRAIVDNVASAPGAYSGSIVERFRELDVATRVRALADKALAKGGTAAVSELADAVNAYATALNDRTAITPAAEPSLAEMLDGLVRKDGLEWRVEDMNVSIGPLHKGDLVLVGARPEVGKTTFLCSEFTHMVTQLPEGKHAVIFNNEEIANKVRVRLVQSALGTTIADLLADPPSASAAYTATLAGRRIDVIHDTALTTKDIEKRLKAGDYGLIGFNILDKIIGFAGKGDGGDKEVERLRKLGIWARGLADKYGVVFALAQADASAEGQRILNQSQLYGTKTGLVSESDAMVMIGKDNTPGMADRRWLNVVRNKMPGGPRTKPADRHGVFEVEFRGDIARVATLAFKKAGRP